MSDSNKYDNLDFCLNVLYDFIYNKNKKSCYKFEHIRIDELTINNIKKPKSFDGKSILSDKKLKYIGQVDKKLLFKKYSDSSYPATIAIQFYNKSNTNINDLNRGEITDIKLMYIFSELYHNEKLRHTLLPIMNFDVTYKDIKDVNSEIYDVIKNKNEHYSEDDSMLVQVFEHYFKMYTLTDYLDLKKGKLTDYQWKVLFFQVLYTLGKIQEKYPSFRHNDLSIDNILLYTTPLQTNTYKLKDTVFNFESDIEIKIHNFYYSTIDKIIENEECKHSKENPYYDLHYFFQTVSYYIENKDVPESVKAFIKLVIPEKYDYKNKNEFIGLDEALYESNVSDIITPLSLLGKNNFFTEFIKDNMDITVSSVSNSPNSIDRYSIKDNSVNYSVSESITQTSDSFKMLGKDIGSMKNSNNIVTGSRALKRATLSDFDIDSEEKIYREITKYDSDLSMSEGGASITESTPSTLGGLSEDEETEELEESIDIEDDEDMESAEDLVQDEDDDFIDENDDSSEEDNKVSSTEQPKKNKKDKKSSTKKETSEEGNTSELRDKKMIKDVLAMSQLSALSDENSESSNNNTEDKFLKLFNSKHDKKSSNNKSTKKENSFAKLMGKMAPQQQQPQVQQKKKLNRFGKIFENAAPSSSEGGARSEEFTESSYVSHKKSNNKHRRNIYDIPKEARPHDTLEKIIVSKLPEGYSGEVPDIYNNNLPMLPSNGMGAVPGYGMGNEMMQQGMQGMPMQQGMQGVDLTGQQTMGSYNGMAGMPGMNMGMPQGMPDMGMPQGIPQGMPNMGMQQMPQGMPDMGMQQMPQGMPDMGMQQMQQMQQMQGMPQSMPDVGSAGVGMVGMQGMPDMGSAGMGMGMGMQMGGQVNSEHNEKKQKKKNLFFLKKEGGRE